MSWRTAYGATLALAAAVVAAPWWGHVDDGDAHLYRVVARNMVEDATWFDLRYLPGAHAVFREHLPFGLWPMAAAIRVAGEGALPWVGAAFTLGTVALVIWIALRLAGPVAGVLAGLVLATTESFVLYGGREKLDPPLVFFATAAVAPLLVHELRARSAAVAAGFGALAALVKGPFGLLPLFAAAVARGWRERRVLWSLGIVLLATLPLLLFLLRDRAVGEGTWWRGYLVDQLLASASGQRTDGKLAPYFPVVALLGRFWPGLALVAFAAWRTWRAPTPALRTLAWCCALTVIGLCVPTRKLWNHTLVAYPLLALYGAVAAAPAIEGWIELRRKGAVAALVAAALAAWSAAFAGLGRHWGPGPSDACAELGPVLDRVRPGTQVAVSSSPIDWPLIAALASERKVVPWPVAPGSPMPDEASVLLWRSDSAPPEGWRRLAASRQWIVYER